jgi:Domain of unknown function (DUF4384)
VKPTPVFNRALCLSVVCLVAFGWGLRAAQDDTTRDIKRKYREFAAQRAKPTRPKAATVAARKKSPSSEPSPDAAPVTLANAVGVTAERLSSNTRLLPGDRVRFTVEVPREGYLYVVSREQFADGSFGEPTLIFPTTRIRNGSNRVSPGLLVGIPALEDNPPFFTLERSRPDQVAESVSILVTPEPISTLAIGREPVTLTREQFAEWRRLETNVEKIELAQSDTKGYTAVEHAAERGLKTRKLTQGDPLPQTLYRLNSANDRLFVTFPIPISK